MTEEEILTQALQGDSDAIRQIAARLKQRNPLEVLRAVDERINYHNELTNFKSRHKDVMKDPVRLKRVIEADVALSQVYPNMPLRERYDMAVKQSEPEKSAKVREPAEEIHGEDMSEFDREKALEDQEALDRMRSSRHQHVMNYDEADLEEGSPDDYEQSQREAMRQTIANRKRLNLKEGD